MQKLSRNRLFSAIGMFMLTAVLWGAAYDSGAGGNAASQADAVALPSEAQEDTTSLSRAGKDVYGVVNVGSGTGASMNARGQVVFETIPTGQFGTAVGFFDGERAITISPPGLLYVSSSQLNDKGEVIFLGSIDDPSYPSAQPFRWSAARGVVQLPRLNQEGGVELNGINNRGTIIGYMYPEFSDAPYRALQWTSLNRLVPLAIPAGFTDTWAADINDNGVTAGSAVNSAGGGSSLILWNANGRPTALGNFGAGGAGPRFLNDRGDIAGIVTYAGSEYTGFFWSPGKGLVRFPKITIPVALNEAGELACFTEDGIGGTKACLFSRERGLVSLHPAQFDDSRTLGLNDSGVIVGRARRVVDEVSHAFRWSRRDTRAGKNLNRLLHNPPAGLHLNAALGVSADGAILASSNAGLLILRPGGGGTDAPVLGPIQVNPTPFVNDLVPLTLSFRDRNVREIHTATVDWGDGNGPRPAFVREANGRGEVRAQHTYADDGSRKIVIRVTDSARRATSVATGIYVGQAGGFPLLAGSGNLTGRASGSVGGTPTTFELAIPVGRQRNADTPFTFRLDGRVSFMGERLDKVAVDGSTVQLEGTGRLNGRSGYRFAIDARAGTLGGGADAGALSIRIAEANHPVPAQRAAFEAGHSAETGSDRAAFTTGAADQGSIKLIQ